MSDYLADVQRYDAGADPDTVAKIVKHLGIALRNRDSSLVSCTDPSELDRVREKWCEKKLGKMPWAISRASSRPEITRTSNPVFRFSPSKKIALLAESRKALVPKAVTRSTFKSRQIFRKL